MTSAAPLTFGDTFTLPATGDAVWKIRDMRADFPHLATDEEQLKRIATVRVETPESVIYAHYHDGRGWWVSGPDSATIQAQLAELDFALAPRSEQEWVGLYRRFLNREVGDEVRSVVNMTDTWAKGANLDPLILRASAAAIYACQAAGLPADENSDLYRTVYDAVITANPEGADQ